MPTNILVFTCSLQTPTYQNPDAMLTKMFLSINRQMDRQTDRQTDKQTDKRTDTDGQTDRQTDLKVSVNTTETLIYHQ